MSGHDSREGSATTGLQQDKRAMRSVMTEIADTAWGSTKLLNEKIVQNLTANTEAAFSAAQAMATAKSLPEIAKLQSEFVQRLAAQASEQTKEFFDLSTRATQHLFEKAQAAAAKSFKPTF